MNHELKNYRKVRLRAFRAIDDQVGCEKYIDGHGRILNSIGIHKVTSSEPVWMFNPDVYVFLVEDSDGEKVMGGGRIHRVNKLQLPIEEAVKEFDENVCGLVKKYDQNGHTGELCGLWNSREVAGMGFGSVFLSRAGVSITNQLGVASLFSLCASYTVNMGLRLGFEVERSLGNDGTFYYPKLDLLATVLILKDTGALTRAETEERNAVFSLRENPTQLKTETFRNKEIIIEYNLDLSR